MRKFVAVVAVLEVLVLAAIVLLVRSGSCPLLTPAGLGGLMRGASGGQTAEGGGTSPRTAPPPSTLPAAAVPAVAASPDAGPAAQGAGTSGDLNQVPDPKCAGKTAAGLLNSQASTTPPSCAPMNLPSTAP